MPTKKETPNATEMVQLEVADAVNFEMIFEHLRENIVDVRELFFEMSTKYAADPSNHYLDDEQGEVLHALHQFLNVL